MPPAAQPPIDQDVLDQGRLALRDLPRYDRTGTYKKAINKAPEKTSVVTSAQNVLFLMSHMNRVEILTHYSNPLSAADCLTAK